MIIEKTSRGCVVQKFNTEKMEWISQEFISANEKSELQVKTSSGFIRSTCHLMMENQYLPFDMVQPK